MVSTRIEVDYLLETHGEVQRVAEFMAGEQSSGTFVAIPGETPELKERVAAQVTRLEILDHAVEGPSLPTRVKVESEARFKRAFITLS